MCRDARRAHVSYPGNCRTWQQRQGRRAQSNARGRRALPRTCRVTASVARDELQRERLFRLEAAEGHRSWVSAPGRCTRPCSRSVGAMIASPSARRPERHRHRPRMRSPRACTAAGVPVFSPHDSPSTDIALAPGRCAVGAIAEHVGQRDPALTASMYTHVPVDQTGADYAEHCGEAWPSECRLDHVSKSMRGW